MAMVCAGCKLSVEPIRIFEKSPKSPKWWRITRCPRERCGYNLDIEQCDKPGTGTHPHSKDKGRSFWRDEDGE